MSEQTPRIGPDGKPTQDWTVNPKARERRLLQEKENATALADAAAPWTRDKIARMIDATKKMEPIHINGQSHPHRLDLHGVTLPEGIDLGSLDLSHANLHGVKAKGVRFSGSDLSNMNAHGSCLIDCIFDDAENMEAINLCQSCLRGSSFNGIKSKVSGGGVLGGEKWEKGLTGANLSESCCHATVRGLDIQEHELTTPLVDDVGRSLTHRMIPGETHVCGDCGETFASVKGRLEHTVREGHAKWSVRSDLKIGNPVEEPAVMDTRLWLQMKGRRPILRDGKLRSIGPQLWRANVTGMLVGHKDRASDQKISVSGVPDEFVL